MLVLTRKRHETIMIGDNIRVVVVRIGPGEVQIGIDAPRNLPVHRLEVYKAIQESKGEGK